MCFFGAICGAGPITTLTLPLVGRVEDFRLQVSAPLPGAPKENGTGIRCRFSYNQVDQARLATSS